MKKSVQILLISLSCLFPLQAQELDRLWEIAALNSPELKLAFTEFKIAMERTSQVALQDPKISMGYFIRPIQTRTGPQVGRLSLSQSFPWFGMLKRQKEGASMLAEAAHFRFIDRRNKLYFDLAAYYYQFVRYKQWMDLERENNEVLQTLKKTAIARYASDQGALVDVLRIQMLLDQSAAQSEIYRAKKQTLWEEIHLLMNSSERFTITAEATPLTDISLTQTPSVDLNPLLLAFDAQIRAAELGEQVALKQNRPNIRLGVDYAIIQQGANLSSSGTDAWMPTLGLSLPIFKQKNTAVVTVATLTTKALQESKEAQFNRLSAAMKGAIFQYQAATTELSVLEKLILTADQSIALLMSAYENDRQDFEEVIRMHQNIIKYKKSFASELEKMSVAREKIDYLSGEFKASNYVQTN